jgi:hypothetical protein
MRLLKKYIIKKSMNEIIIFIAPIWAFVLESLYHVPCSFICHLWLHKDSIKNRREVSDTTNDEDPVKENMIN